ncbi:MAG: glucose-6-phosphate isomerase [Pseudomonadota bacterium]
MTDALSQAWTQLQTEGDRLRATHLRQFFAEDAERAQRLALEAEGLYLDFSKEKLDATALQALVALAEAASVEEKREQLFSGAEINVTEGRAVQHMALRAPPGTEIRIGGSDVMPAVLETRRRFLAFAEQVRDGSYAASERQPFTDVINIGIGGSDLGPVMAVRALAPDADGPRLHFVSNVDGAHLTDVLRPLDPARTLIIIASKTFTTQETMRNAVSARDWLRAALGAGADRHMAAVSTNLEGTADFGIAQERVFGFWDWVGGRYSLWSAIGLPLAIAIGAKNFEAFLAGGSAMDRHFRSAPLAANLPVLLALIGIWRRNILGYPAVALIPYDQRLERFPAYIQQLDMESNGKSRTLDGRPVTRATGPLIFGEPGTNAQHSFFQLVHQGSDVIPVDFIAAVEPREQLADHHRLLLANCLAQSQALAFGRSEAEVRAEMQAAGKDPAEIDRLAPHRVFPGDRPSTTLLQERLDPFALGRLVALFEHKVFVQGVIWDVNSYDQWGVELGKVLAKALIPVLEGSAEGAGLDGSTAALAARIRAG